MDKPITEIFDPEVVKNVDPWSYWINAGEVVKRSDYDKLLALYRALQPQMTLSERYGTIEVK